MLIGTVGPFLWLVSSSFQYERQLLNRPPQWLPNPIVLDSYREIFEGAVLGEASGVPYQSRIFPAFFRQQLFRGRQRRRHRRARRRLRRLSTGAPALPRAQPPALRHSRQPLDPRPFTGDPHRAGRQEGRHERQDRLTRLYQPVPSSCPTSSGCCKVIFQDPSRWNWKTRAASMAAAACKSYTRLSCRSPCPA